MPIQIVMEGWWYLFISWDGKTDLNTWFVNSAPKEERFGNLIISNQIETFVFWDEVG